jgi:hypothetical protein
MSQEFDNIISQREKVEEALKRRRQIIKFVIFFTILVVYIKVLLFDNFIQYFNSSGVLGPISSYRSGSPGGFIVMLIFGIIFIWLPKNSFNWLDEKIPPEAFKFFGWVIFIIPALLWIIYHFIT